MPSPLESGREDGGPLLPAVSTVGDVDFDLQMEKTDELIERWSHEQVFRLITTYGSLVGDLEGET